MTCRAIEDTLSDVSTELIVGLASGVPILVSILASVWKYVASRSKTNVTIVVNGDKLELNNVTAEEAEKLIHEWVLRHTDDGVAK